MGGTLKETPSRFILPVTIRLGNTTQELLALVDSGMEDNLLDLGVASRLRLPLEPLPSPIMVSALDGGILTTITHKTKAITLIISGNHCELIEFLLFCISSVPLILGYPWLALHNPHIPWSDRQIEGWSLFCLRSALQSIR